MKKVRLPFIIALLVAIGLFYYSFNLVPDYIFMESILIVLCFKSLKLVPAYNNFQYNRWD